ncbi:hypothetical protein NBRGN_110_03920 [Nocardia brasiliensis NBRC 14402]|nr:hypothetical protein NBRGN_110_03920 [Nocardia brasiliensis NBRC 14402]
MTSPRKRHRARPGTHCTTGGLAAAAAVQASRSCHRSLHTHTNWGSKDSSHTAPGLSRLTQRARDVVPDLASTSCAAIADSPLPTRSEPCEAAAGVSTCHMNKGTQGIPLMQLPASAA